MSYVLDPVARLAPVVTRPTPVRLSRTLARRIRMGEDTSLTLVHRPDPWQAYRAGERGDYTDAPGYTPVSAEKSVATMTSSESWLTALKRGTPPAVLEWTIIAGAAALAVVMVRGRGRGR